MPTDCITYQKSGYFINLIVDYLDEKPELKSFYNRFPKIKNFKSQIEEKHLNFNDNDNYKRQILVDELEIQYQNFEVTKTTSNNIKLLNRSNTYTITTGHQLNLFTGPLYFLYKIISTINLCKELKIAYPENDFVPIYWMATEDHDFEEINHFTFKGKKISWQRDSSRPVGRLATDGLDEVYDLFASVLGTSHNAETLKKLFQEAYLGHKNLAKATRYLANQLFGEHGLVILDADSKTLKTSFIPYIKDELLHQSSFAKVTETITKLNYDIQVNPREINLFYIEDNLRERIIVENGIYKINNTKIEFSEAKILELVATNPEKFSPNVIFRPLYQEVILPNLCYIGGGGEIAYWLELKAMFNHHNITFPMLLVRNSVVLVSEKQTAKANKLHLPWGDLFINQQDLYTQKTKQFSEFTIDFSILKEALQKQFEDLLQLTKKTDKSFLGAVKAQEAKQIKGLENLEKRLLKAEKKVHAEQLERIILLQNELFPNQGLQERKCNFAEFYLEFGDDFIKKLANELQPLSQNFSILSLITC